MVRGLENDDSEINDIVAKFPGPVTLSASRVKWWLVIFASGLGTATSIFFAIFFLLHPARVIGDVGPMVGSLIFCTIITGVGTMIGVIALRRGALRLDGEGFEVAAPICARYLWNEVSDFGVFRRRYTALVAFKTARPRGRVVIGRLNALLASGRNDGLPDTYGLSAVQLVQLMERWQSSTVSATTSKLT